MATKKKTKKAPVKKSKATKKPAVKAVKTPALPKPKAVKRLPATEAPPTPPAADTIDPGAEAPVAAIG